MAGDYDLISGKEFGKFQTNLMGGFSVKIIVGTEGLHDMIVLSAVCLAEFIFDETEFIQRGFGHTVDARNENAAIGFLSVHHVGKDIIHGASCSNEFNDCHSFSTSSFVSVRSTARTYPELTALVS